LQWQWQFQRAIRFSVNVNSCCPQHFANEPSKIGTALKEAKESRVELVKLRLGNLQNYSMTAQLDLESEATQLSAIYASIIRNMEARLQREKDEARREKEERAKEKQREKEERARKAPRSRPPRRDE
jgi:hypothetical protein